MDIVFVVDDSGSMSQEQKNLGENFPAFAKVLDEYKISTGEKLDYRVAVTATGRTVHVGHLGWFGDRIYDGRLVPNGQYSVRDGEFFRVDALNRRWIESNDANRQALLSDVASIGIGGSYLEMPLEAARIAVTDKAAAQQANAGFLRDDALLALVLLTDEEDCSRQDGTGRNDFIVLGGGDDEAQICDGNAPLTSTQTYVDAFDKVKGDRAHWATAVIAGGERACESTGLGKAEASPRLIEFTKQTGKNAVFHSICDGDLSAALKQALDTFQQACNNIPPVD